MVLKLGIPVDYCFFVQKSLLCVETHIKAFSLAIYVLPACSDGTRKILITGISQRAQWQKRLITAEILMVRTVDRGAGSLTQSGNPVKSNDAVTTQTSFDYNKICFQRFH